MDPTDQITFGDLQKQEQFRKLQRELKLARIKQIESLKPKTSGTISAAPWSSCSSINTDPSDSNSTGTSLTLQTSRTRNQVLTASRHLRNLVSKSSNFHKPMATSSVKQFSETDQTIDDRAIMPPPPNFNLIRPPTKRPASLSQIKTTRTNSMQSPFSDAIYNIDHPEDSGCPDDDQSRGKPLTRDFYRWRISLNDQGQIIIKGVLESKKIVRSKPVLRMLSSIKLESIYNHTYFLHGNIIDDKNELPKYIYTKFFSGFPDDWENVLQIWKNFVAQGCRESYRWPTDVSFSDDDLNSEITDITDIQKTNEKKFQEFNSIDKSIPQRSSGYSSDIQQEWNSKSSDTLNRDVNLDKNLHLSRRNQNIGVLSFSNEKENRCPSGNGSQIENKSQDKNKSSFENRSQSENRSGNLYTALNYAQTLKDFIFEDKLTIITQNLLSENCPREYVSYVNQMIENLNYLISYKISNLNESSDIKEAEQRSNFQPERQMEKQYEENTNLTSLQILKSQIPIPKTNHDFSESETYAGVPKISVDRIFQSKPYHLRYKEWKLERNLKSNKSKLIAENCKNNLGYDTSESLTEEEILKNYEGGKAVSNLNKAQVFGRNPDWNSNSTRQNCVPLEVTRKTYLEDDRNCSVVPNSSSVNLIPSDSKQRKTQSDMENIKANKQIAFLETSPRKQDLTIVNSEMCEKSKRPHKNLFLNFESDDNQEQKEKDKGFKNPFLKNSEIKQDSKKNTCGNLENSGNDSFGSKQNPKLLESWTPCVTFDGNDYHLAFEGILLNSVGRPMKKKFISNHVVRRVSSKIIETTDHQFYKLIGDAHNIKHAVPKQLWSQCRNGCPTKIDNFCSTWIKLTGEKNVINEGPQKTVVELPKNVPSSSRGRRILPPLNYWADERVVMKDNNAVYKPGDPKNHFVSSGIKSPKKPRNIQDQRNQTEESESISTSKKVGKKSKPTLSNEDPLASNEARKASNSEEMKCPGKNAIAHKLIFSSSDSEDTQERINPRLKKNRGSLDVNGGLSGGRKKFSRKKQISPDSSPYKLRKRQKIAYKIIDTDIESDKDSAPSGKNEKAKWYL